MDQMVKAFLSFVAKPALTGFGPSCSSKAVICDDTANNDRLETHLDRDVVGRWKLLGSKQRSGTPMVENRHWYKQPDVQVA